MAREILFRARRINTGEWVEGFYVHIPCGRFLCDEHLIQTVEEDGRIGLLCTVYEHTVGQFTGLTDKNGKRIFEGDILRYYDDEIQVVEWNSEWSQIMLHTYGEYEFKRGRRIVKEKQEGWNHLTDYHLEKMPIIGNIHENPELLKEETK